jgi:hypothetical protein
MSETVQDLQRSSWRYCEAQIPSHSRSHVSYMHDYSRFFGPFQWDTTVTVVPKTNVTRLITAKKHGDSKPSFTPADATDFFDRFTSLFRLMILEL